MKNLIFIGGFENTGTRLIVEFLLKTGYITINPNRTIDYLGNKFLKLFDEYWNNNNIEPLISKIESDIYNIDENNIVIKHGHLCFLNKNLKEKFPNSRNILCIRNPFDILVKESHNYKRYGKLNKKNLTTKNKLEHLKLWYSDNIIEKSDIIIKLEDVVFETNKTLKYLANTLNIRYTDKQIEEFTKEIIPSKTIGKGKQLLDTETDEVIKDIRDFSKKLNYDFN